MHDWRRKSVANRRILMIKIRRKLAISYTNLFDKILKLS